MCIVNAVTPEVATTPAAESCDDGEPNLAAFRHDLSALAASYGYSGAVYVHVGHGLGGAADPALKFLPRRLAGTGGFNEVQYIRRNYLAHDPVAALAVGSLAPFAWTITALEAVGQERAGMLRAMQAWGMQAGLVAPIQDYAEGPAFLNFFTNGEPMAGAAASDHGEVLLAALRTHVAALKSLPCTGALGNGAILSPREMAVLRLAAIGRTEQETALSLVLSRRGVQFHLARAMEKLGASNKTAAVAKAVGAGLIHP